jgi:phenolic acid decarboxylase
MSQNLKSTQLQELNQFVGKHFIYTYENGWQYELYVKNASTIDYRIHSGMVGGRWVKSQKVNIARLSDDIFRISWDEPTGTSVSIAFMLNTRQVHGVAFFPAWIEQNPQLTICFQNDHEDEMYRYRDAGPTYPKLVVDEFASITFMENVGTNREDIIACAPDLLPENYAARCN